MPYLGNEPGAITDAFTQTFTGDASTTNFTLSQSSTTNAVFVRISGVMQRNGTDFTVSGTTLAFTTAPPALSNNIVVQFFTVGSIQTIADDAVATAKIADSAVSTAKIADNAITLAKLAGGTDGNIISFDASGDPVAIATGNDGQVLTSTGAGSPPAFETISGGGYEFVSATTASSSSTIDFEGLSGNFDYLAVFSNLKHSTDANLFLRFGASTTYITANYQSSSIRNTNSDVYAEGADGSGQQQIELTNDVTGGAASEIITGRCEIFDLANSSFNTTALTHLSNESNGAAEEMTLSAGRYEIDAALTDIRFLPSTGNFTSGVIRLYKRPSA